MVYLERITMRNFKSFRSCVIPFSKHFNAVVGPNGSGKSNIVDAIMFVLGEGRLKVIRANRLQDLVFHKARSGEAVVSIDLSDGKKTYTISRSIDKNGKSIYRLNGKRATRNQIRSVLSSLGASSDGHNIILQGEVAKIIKMSPAERRQVLEEIAGISEYEEKKGEALKEIEEVNGKIREVSVLLGEKKRVLERLYEEKKAAEEYIELRRRVRSLRKAMLLQRIQKTKTALELLEKTREELKVKIQECNDRLENLNKKRTKFEEILGNLERKIADMYAEAGKADTERIQAYISGKKSEIRVLSEELQNVEKEIEHLRKKKESIEKEINIESEKTESIRDTYDKKIKILEDLKKEFRELLERFESEKEKISESERRLLKIEAEIEKKKKEFSELKAEHSRLVGELNAKVELAGKNLNEKLRELEAEKEKILGERNALFEKEKNLNREYIRISEEIKSLREKVGSCRGATSVLRNMGVSTDVLDKLLDAQKKGELFGIHGFVANIIKYDERYERAIEAAAGRRLFYIVTDTTDAAVEAIKYLKRNQLGRATFIPLDRALPRKTDIPEGCLGCLVDFIEYNEKYSRVIKNIFGDTIVVKDIDDVKKIAGKYRVVTLEGDLAERTGIISGGSTQKTRVLELLRGEEYKKQLSEKEAEMKEVLDRLRNVRDAIQKTSLILGNMDEKINALKEKIKVEEEYDKIREKIEEIEQTMRKLAEEISELEMEKSKIKQEKLPGELLEKMNTMREKIATAEEECAEIKAVLEKHEHRKSVLEEQIKGVTEYIERLEKKYGEIKEKIRVSERDVKRAEEELERIEAQMKVKAEELEEVKREKKYVESELKRIMEETGKMLEKKRELESDLVSAESKIESASFTISELEREIKEYEDVEHERNLPENPDREIEMLLEKMRALEPVNLKALEEYEEWEKDVRTIEEKVKKLEEEKEAIYRLISEIEKKKKTAFMKTFREVSAKFSDIFREMAQGEGNLKLTNEENIFEAGLVIEAKPKGKELKNIEAMSGGEKALVALAFMFAVAMHKASGFYILDEPDLMLDKKNAEKMAKYIKKISKNVQFIVISHRDPVVKEADQIIGVYTSKNGSSAVEIRN